VTGGIPYESCFKVHRLEWRDGRREIERKLALSSWNDVALRVADDGERVIHHRNWRGPVMFRTTARMWGAGSLLLNPGRMVDWLLDQLELSVAMMPVQTEMIPCREARRETRFD
jgi:hypothetical protein